MTLEIRHEEPLLEKIAQQHSGLRKSERKVADVVLSNPRQAVKLNMAGLAESAGVSVPTVMRFCNSLGYEGFQAFRMALAQTLALGLPVTHAAIRSTDSASDLAEKIFSQTISTLDRARRRLDVDKIDQAIDLLSKADEILFIGFGASGIIAADAQQKFPLFGVPCSAPADYHQQFIAATMSGPSTVTFAISNTASTRETVHVAEAAAAAGGKIIAMTGQDGPLGEVADLELRVNTFEDTDYYTPSVSRLAGLVIIDVLATGVALLRPESERERIRVMKEKLAEMRSSPQALTAPRADDGSD